MSFLALFAGGKLAKYLEYAAVVVAIFLLGFAFGQHNVTKTAIEVVADRDARELAAATGAIAADVNAQHHDFQTHLAADLAKGRKADDVAMATLTKAKDEARHDSSLALLQLAKETHPDAPLSCPAYTWSPDARSVLDRAAGARDPAPDSSIINPIAPASRSFTASGRAAVPNPR